MTNTKTSHIFSGVGLRTDDYNNEIPITSESSEQDILDFMAVQFARELRNCIAFKGGYILNQILPTQSRLTRDIDFSIEDYNLYLNVKDTLQSIAEQFKNVGLIDNYRIKEDISETSSGGIDLYRNSSKILGVDVGLHGISWGITEMNLKGEETVRFSIERMLADKLMAILSRKRFRRTKDLYDLWVITNNFNFSYKELQECIANRGLPEWNNIPFNETTITEYKKAWDKLSITSAINSEQLEKPAFEETIQRFYAIAIPLKTGQHFSYWNHKELHLC